MIASGARSRAVTDVEVREAAQRKMLPYDRAGEEHFNIISALHKSLRGSDPDAGLYWLARMLEAGGEAPYLAPPPPGFASPGAGPVPAPAPSRAAAGA